MADDTVQVKLGADAADLQTGMQAAVDSIKDSTSGIKDSLTDLQSQSQAATQGVSQGFQQLRSDLQSTISQITSTISMIGQAALGIGALLAGGSVFKGVVDSFVNMNLEAAKLASTMGMATPDAAALVTAFERVGIAGDTLNSMAMRMTRQLKANEEQFNANGVATRDASGAMLPMQSIMLNVIGRLDGMKAGYDRTALAQLAFGRGTQDIANLMRITQQAIDDEKERLASLGLTIDDISVAKARKFKEGMADVGLVFDALKYQIGEEMIPVLTSLAQAFTKIGPPAVAGLRELIKWFEDLGGTAGRTGSLVRDSLEAAFAPLTSVMALLGAVKGDFAAAWDSIKGGAEKVKDALAADSGSMAATFIAGVEAMERKIAEWRAQAINESAAVSAAMGAASGALPGGKAPGTAAFVPKATGGGAGGAPSIVQEWQAELDKLKASDAAFQDSSIAMEKAYWQTVLETGKDATKQEQDALQAAEKGAAATRLEAEKQFWIGKLAACTEGTKEYDAVLHRITQIDEQENKARLQSELELIKSKVAANQTGLKDYAANINEQIKLDKDGLAQYKEDLQAKVNAGQISTKDMLLDYRAMMVQLKQHDIQILEDFRATCTQGTALWKQMTKEIETAQAELGTDIKKSNVQITTEERKDWMEAVKDIGRDLEKGFTDAFNLVSKGSKNFVKDMEKTFIDLFKQIGEQMFQIFVVKWIENLILGKIAASTTNMATVASEAGVAGAAAVASVMMALPFPANLAAAPAAGMAAAAEAMAFAPAASAQGGAWEIPREMTTRLHPEEMVLPAGPAAGLRSMIEGGGGGGGTPLTVHFNVSAIDAAGVRQFFQENRLALAKSLNKTLQELTGQKLLPAAYQ